MTACSTFWRDGFRGLFHLLQDESGNLRGRIGLAVASTQGVAVGCLDDLVGTSFLSFSTIGSS